jgi:hypothetical protein
VAKRFVLESALFDPARNMMTRSEEPRHLDERGARFDDSFTPFTTSFSTHPPKRIRLMNAPAPPAPGPLSVSDPWNLASDGYAAEAAAVMLQGDAPAAIDFDTQFH